MAIGRSEGPGEVVRSLSFGSVAEQYERYRLTYPEELADVVLAYAGRPVRSALEVGAGTGKATRLFAGRVPAVTALEPDAEMIRVLTRTTRGLPVHPVVGTFEGFATDRRFDLLYAAASWHWTDPATRWARAVELLVPGGVLALFGCPADLADPAQSAAVEEIERELLPDEGPDVAHAWSLEEMTAVDGLTDVVRRHLRRVVTVPAVDWVGRLATVSAYLVLPPQVRADALRRVAEVLPAQVDVDATVEVTLARRVCA